MDQIPQVNSFAECVIERLLTAMEVSEILNVSVDWVCDHAGPGSGLRIPAIPLGTGRGRGRNMWRFRPADVRKFIEAQVKFI